MPQSWLIKWFASHICTLSFGEKVCANIIFSLCGYDVPQMNEVCSVFPRMYVSLYLYILHIQVLKFPF